MKVEERVRRALLDDASKLEVPRRPSLADLDRARRRSRWVWVAAAVAVASVVVGVAVAVGVMPQGTVTIGPGDGQTSPDIPSHDLQYDDDEVFAQGTSNGVPWEAAAIGGEHPCVGVRVESDRRFLGSSRCGPLDSSPVMAINQTDPDAGVVAIAGWVSDEVARLVWELPDGTLELQLERHDGLPARVFGAAATPGEEGSALWAYDDTGRRIGGTGVTGAREPNQDQRDAAD